MKVAQSCPTLWPHGLHSPWNSPGKSTGVGSLSILQGIFPNQGSNPGVPHCRLILNQLSHKGSPRIPEWVAYPFSSRSSQPRNQLGSPFCRWILYQLRYQGSPPNYICELKMTTNSLAHFPLRSGVSVSVPWNWVGSVIALNNRIRGMWHHVDYAMLIGSVERTTERPAWRGSMDPAELLGDSSIDLPALAGNLSEEALWFQVGQLHLMPRELEGSCGHPPTQTVNSWANECCCFKQLSFGHGLWFSNR